MSQVLTPRTETTGGAATPPGSTTGRGRRSTVLLVVLLALLVGTAVGFAAYAVGAGAPEDTRGTDAWQARLEGEAELHAQREAARGRAAEQRRWEAQADRYAPGWRDE